MDNVVLTSDSPEASPDDILIDCDDSSATADDSPLLSDGHLAELNSAHHPPSFDENNSVGRRCPISVKKRLLIGCLLGSSITLLAVISTGFILSKKLSKNFDTTTTTTETTLPNQSSTTTIETVTSSSKSCSIPTVNGKWNETGFVLINPGGECSSNEYGLCHSQDFFFDDIHYTLYVADTKNDRIQKYSLNEPFNPNPGLLGVTVASRNLSSPQSLFVDVQTEDIYILDFLENDTTDNKTDIVSYRVHLWKKNDQIGKILLSEQGEYLYSQFIHRLRLDKQMNIYVGTRYFIKKWLKSTDYTQNVIVAGESQLNLTAQSNLWDPVGFVVADDLTLFIADWQNKRIQKWKVNATEEETIVKNLTYVIGLTMDCNGFLYYVDMYERTIHQIDLVNNQKRVIVTDQGEFRSSCYFGQRAIRTDRFENIFLLGDNQLCQFSLQITT
ncbi:unnamed protein product [Adineta ricciae]|uniref:Uncharacterized protein n=1 Tax=Adineta ricciae TaxID=249248 RepID=A0A815BR77_ADIRI|nr:unnamed protein product [Adineta ricciae]